MTINYHLLKSTKRGIIINKESLFSDIPELTLAFHLDGIDKSTYLCIVKNENNTEHRQYLSNGKIRIEKVTQLFPSKTLNITLVESKNNVAVATYDCEPLSFTNSGDMLKSVWEVYPQLAEFPDRVKQIEIQLAETETVSQQLVQLKAWVKTADEMLKAHNDILSKGL